MPYPFTPNDDANRLLAQDGTAMLIGMCLDQQVRTETAFAGPFRRRERIRTSDAAKIAALPQSKRAAACRTNPALHRYPGMMSERVRALCSTIVRDYAGKGARVWTGIKTGEAAFERLVALPGFGQAKANCGVRILGKFCRVPVAGWPPFGRDGDLPWGSDDGRRIYCLGDWLPPLWPSLSWAGAPVRVRTAASRAAEGRSNTRCHS